jgi:hypothetical protein
MEEILGGHNGQVYRCKECRSLQRTKTNRNTKCLKCGKLDTLERCKLAVFDGQIIWHSKSDPLPNFAMNCEKKED